MRLPIEPFREWMHLQLKQGETIESLAVKLDTSPSRIKELLERRSHIELHVADYMFCKAGHPELLAVIWPEEEETCASS